MSGLSTLVRAPLSYKRGGTQRYRLKLTQTHLDPAQAHKFIQALKLNTLRFGDLNHSKPLCVLVFIHRLADMQNA